MRSSGCVAARAAKTKSGSISVPRGVRAVCPPLFRAVPRAVFRAVLPPLRAVRPPRSVMPPGSMPSKPCMVRCRSVGWPKPSSSPFFSSSSLSRLSIARRSAASHAYLIRKSRKSTRSMPPAPLATHNSQGGSHSSGAGGGGGGRGGMGGESGEAGGDGGLDGVVGITSRQLPSTPGSTTPTATQHYASAASASRRSSSARRPASSTTSRPTRSSAS